MGGKVEKQLSICKRDLKSSDDYLMSMKFTTNSIVKTKMSIFLLVHRRWSNNTTQVIFFGVNITSFRIFLINRLGTLERGNNR
jgi:hypothetical protein